MPGNPFDNIPTLSAIYDDDEGIQELVDSGQVTTASNMNRPEPTAEVQKINLFNDFMYRNPKAGGGMLVKPSADGSRPGYAGKKAGVKEATTIAEGTKLANQYNKIITTAFEKEDMSKIPSWKSFLESKNLKHAGVGFYRTQAKNFGVINASEKKFQLADILIERANNKLKHTEWMDIQKKLSNFSEIDTRQFREYIDKLDTKADKASKAFDYLLDNDIQLKSPKNLSKTMAAEGSLLRKVISDITGVKSSKSIRPGLDSNKRYNKFIKQIKFANQGNLWTEGEGRTLSEILENADYRMKGNISWTSDIKDPKIANSSKKNVFDYALRNFNYHQLNKTGEGTIQFYDKKTNKPINWNTLPKNKNGFRTLKPNSVYFIDASMPNKKWDLASIEADSMKWSKGTGSSGLFDEVFEAKDTYDKLLSEEVINPKNGRKTTFGKLMKDVYEVGFDNFGNPYAIDHKDGVANNPFKNLRIASQRINSALSALNRDTTLNKYTKDQLFKVLKEGTFDPNQKNVIDTIIKGTAPIREDVLLKGKKFDQGELDMAKQKFLTNLNKNKFRRVSKVLVDAAIDGGFGEAVQKICRRLKAKKGGRIFLSNGTGCPAADQDPKGFLRNVSESPVLKKFFTSSAGQKAAAAAARVTSNVLNPSTLIGGEVAFVLADGFNNFSKGMDLAESFDRAFIFKDFKQFDKNLIEQAKNLGYDENQLNLLQETININRLDNRERALKLGLDIEKSDISGLTSDATMGFENDLRKTQNQLDQSVGSYVDTLGKMGFDLTKDSSYDVGFRYLDNVFKKKTQDELLKTYDQRKRQVDPTSGKLGNILDPIFDLGAYTQPVKYMADIVNPFTKNVPFLSERQRQAKYLKEMGPRELYLYNKQRGFTLDDIEAGTSPYIRETMNQLGTATTGQGFFQPFAGGGIAKIAGIDQGPQITSMNPDSGGLKGILKRAMKLKE